MPKLPRSFLTVCFGWLSSCAVLLIDVLQIIEMLMDAYKDFRLVMKDLRMPTRLLIRMAIGIYDCSGDAL